MGNSSSVTSVLVDDEVTKINEELHDIDQQVLQLQDRRRKLQRSVELLASTPALSSSLTSVRIPSSSSSTEAVLASAMTDDINIHLYLWSGLNRPLSSIEVRISCKPDSLVEDLYQTITANTPDVHFSMFYLSEQDGKLRLKRLLNYLPLRRHLQTAFFIPNTDDLFQMHFSKEPFERPPSIDSNVKSPSNDCLQVFVRFPDEDSIQEYQWESRLSCTQKKERLDIVLPYEYPLDQRRPMGLPLRMRLPESFGPVSALPTSHYWWGLYPVGQDHTILSIWAYCKSSEILEDHARDEVWIQIMISQAFLQTNETRGFTVRLFSDGGYTLFGESSVLIPSRWPSPDRSVA